MSCLQYVLMVEVGIDLMILDEKVALEEWRLRYMK